jgi:hypothetical protein
LAEPSLEGFVRFHNKSSDIPMHCDCESIEEPNTVKNRIPLSGGVVPQPPLENGVADPDPDWVPSAMDASTSVPVDLELLSISVRSLVGMDAAEDALSMLSPQAATENNAATEK